MQKKLTVSIGIPAYNEEQNIKQLLCALLRQKQTNFVLKEIIVVSDGSTDETVALARAVNSKRIRVVDGKKRKGQQVRQNQLLNTYQGDVLVLIEADTLPANDQAIRELVKPFVGGVAGNLGMTVSEWLAAPPRGWLEKILWHGGEFKNEIFRDWKSGNNIYTCHGNAFRALSRSLTCRLLWPDNVPEDAYAYLFIKQLRLRMQRQKKALAYMKHVSTAPDRLRQCAKYVSGKKELEKYFPADLVQAEYRLPSKLVVRHIGRAMLTKPWWTTLALMEMAMNRVLVRRHRQFQALYTPYRSSKNLNRVKLSLNSESRL